MRVLFRSHSFINAASWVGTMHWMRRWWVLGYFPSSLFTCLYHLPQYFVFCSKWPAQCLPRNTYSLDSLGSQTLQPLFSGSLCIGSEIMREWALSPPRVGPTVFYSVLRSYPSHTRYVNWVYNSLHDANYLVSNSHPQETTQRKEKVKII